VLAIAASLWAVMTPRPDVLIANDGQAAVLRGADGRLAVLSSGRDTFAIKEWLAADGDSRTPNDAGLKDGVHCDPVGCIGRLKDGRMVSMALSVEAFAEDCTQAAVVVSPRQAPGDCAALLIDRRTWRTEGALALRAVGDSFELSAGRPPGYVRPWAPQVRGTNDGATRSLRPAARDATPRVEDLEPGDQ
jgi:competence protein ComEC